MQTPSSESGSDAPACKEVWHQKPDTSAVYVSNKVILRFSCLAAFFLLATLFAHLWFHEKTAKLPGFVFIDVDSEANIPTWYSCALLQFCGVVAFVIGNFDASNQKTGWRGISLILVLMGMDEIASIHNLPSRRLSEVVGISDGYLTNAWVIPASLLCITLAAIYLPFIWRLPKWLKRALIFASIAYLCGAVGFEVVGSKLEFDAGGLNYDGLKHYSLRFEMAAVAEEIFEYVGILAALAALLRHASNLNAFVKLSFQAPSRRENVRSTEASPPPLYRPI